MLCIEKELGKYSWRRKREQTEEEKPRSHAATCGMMRDYQFLWLKKNLNSSPKFVGVTMEVMAWYDEQTWSSGSHSFSKIEGTPNALSSGEPCFASQYIFAGGVSGIFSTFVVLLRATGMVWVQGMALGEKKIIVEEGNRMNYGNLSVLVHHEDLLIKFLTLQKCNVAKLQAELLMACLSVTTAVGKYLTHTSWFYISFTCWR